MSDPASAAFDQLRAEVALLRRAVEGLSAQQPEAPPNYSPALAKIEMATTTLGTRIEELAAHPALAVTPDQIASLLRSHTTQARTEVRGELSDAIRMFTKAATLLDSLGIRVRTRDEQWRWLAYAALAGAVAGLVAWLGLSGPISRSLPASWQVPERVAAAALGQDRWAAGARLMRGADEAGWRRLRLGDELMLRNSDLIAACAKRADRLKRSVVCGVHVGGQATGRLS